MSSENLPPDVIKRILKELKELNSNPLEGITLLPLEEDISNIDALIVGPNGTPYEGGHFKARLILSSEFPGVPPKANFLTKIFHPNVSKKGEICVNTLKKDWSSDLGIKHILLTIKCLLIVPNADSALNEDASILLLENYDDYCKHAKMFTSIHAKATVIAGTESTGNTSGVSSSNVLTSNSTNIEANNKSEKASTTSSSSASTTSTTSSTTTTAATKKKAELDTSKAKKSLKRL
ncbi:ubiquitin-conjugating enzyme E2 S [Heterostelium album PN500]|uniref:E2 ubiquitin-conjugating enzyme n=1 Tax=Heterostelium pallidum (strain ATCC 26659 / Pp 5 / PN500) TaxID=670386 RepID=D3B9K9_HETP5|nr:ubiquitin-conjugating enzyme E2 S [Heterostelium album PN500]EFA81921.1 ubiquitin-conjugating enzyme E2 S [Heterostelium album PN500]|eukprot:XP_020434038.1 ubiquitin-conjugating enzyme E2 S [Heterostelium album PN500]